MGRVTTPYVFHSEHENTPYVFHSEHENTGLSTVAAAVITANSKKKQNIKGPSRVTINHRTDKRPATGNCLWTLNAALLQGVATAAYL